MTDSLKWWAELDWVAIGEIILIDVLLGGDNALLIALACRNLPRTSAVSESFGALPAQSSCASC